MLGQCLLSMFNNLKETRWRYSGVRFKIQNIVYKLLISAIYCDIIKLVGRFLPPVHHLFSHLLHTDGVAAIVPLPLLCEIYAARVNQPKNPGRRVAPSMRQSKLSQSTRGWLWKDTIPVTQERLTGPEKVLDARLSWRRKRWQLWPAPVVRPRGDKATVF